MYLTFLKTSEPPLSNHTTHHMFCEKSETREREILNLLIIGVLTLLQVLAATPNNGSPQQQQPARHLSIHEHEAMDLLQKYKISVPKYDVAHSAEDAFKIAKEYGELVVL